MRRARTSSMSDAQGAANLVVQAEAPESDESYRNTSIAQRLTGSTAFWMGLVILALVALFSIISPNHAFFQLSNFQDMALDVTETMVLALGMTFVLGAGELDLSIGANLLLSSVLAGQTIVSLSGTTNQVAAGLYPHEGIAIAAGVAVGI